MSGEPPLYDAVMSDPLVVAWRAFSDRFMDPDYRDDPERMHIRDAFAAGWDAGTREAIAQERERLAAAVAAIDLGLYPAASPAGPRTDEQTGWNRGAEDMLAAVLALLQGADR